MLTVRDQIALTSSKPAIIPIGAAYRSSQPTYVDGQAAILHTDVNGNLKTNSVFSSAATATLSNVNDTASSTQLSAANANRKGWSVTNDSSSILYINFGATASTTAYSVQLAPGAYYEMPAPIYTGVINGIWSGDSTGAARITELTA